MAISLFTNEYIVMILFKFHPAILNMTEVLQLAK